MGRDLHIDLFQNTDTTDKLQNILGCYDLSLVNTEATCVLHTLIDHFFSNISRDNLQSKTLSSGISDHKAVILSINNIKQSQPLN